MVALSALGKTTKSTAGPWPAKRRRKLSRITRLIRLRPTARLSTWLLEEAQSAGRMGSAIQILALQALAFEVLADCGSALPPAVSVALTLELSRASGVNGMVGGQALDLEADKQGRPENPDAGHVSRLQAMKTGALIRFSCEAGAIIATADATTRTALSDFGRHLGYAFQIADALLDAEGDEQRVGKALAKDAAAGKATLVSLLGLEAAKAELRNTVENAKASLLPFGAKAKTLVSAAEFVAYRDK